MNKIVVFREVEKMALSHLESMVLFGESDLVSDGKEVYDLVFHAKRTYPYSTRGEASIIMPVLNLRSGDRDEIVKKVYNAYSSHPDFTRYAVAGTSLKFCEVIPGDYGKHIVIAKARPVSKREFLNLSKKESPELARHVMEKIRVIDRNYHAASWYSL